MSASISYSLTPSRAARMAAVCASRVISAARRILASASASLMRRISCNVQRRSTMRRGARMPRRSAWRRCASVESTRWSRSPSSPGTYRISSAPSRSLGSSAARLSTGKAGRRRSVALAPSTPARRPVQVSRSGSRGRTNSVSFSARPGAITASASGSVKPVRYQRSLDWRKRCSTSLLRTDSFLPPMMATARGPICSISCCRRAA